MSSQSGYVAQKWSREISVGNPSAIKTRFAVSAGGFSLIPDSCIFYPCSIKRGSRIYGCGLPLTQISAKHCKRLRGFRDTGNRIRDSGFGDKGLRIREAGYGIRDTVRGLR